MKLAIDIALLPPANIMDICIEINHQDPEAFASFNKKDNFPHITLAMGIMDESDLPKANKIIEKLAKKLSPLDLEIWQLYHYLTPDNKKSYGFAIKAK